MAIVADSRPRRPAASPSSSRIVAPADLPPLDEVELVGVDRCNLCGSAGRDVLLTARHRTALCRGEGAFHVAVCRDCGLLYLTETLPRQILEYPGKHGGSLLYGLPLDEKNCRKYFDKQRAKGQQIAAWVERQIGPLAGKRTLDVLSGAGGLVHALAGLGARAEGLEPSAALAGYGRRAHGLRVHEALLEGFRPSHGYDVVTAVQVLNHYLDPAEVLGQLRSLLAPGGVLVTQTLDFPHAISRKSLAACIHVDHPVMFTAATLRAYFAKTGFAVTALRSDATSRGDFGSLNHILALCEVCEPRDDFLPGPQAAIDAKLQCLAALSQYHADVLAAANVTGGNSHKRGLLRRIGRLFRKPRS